MTQEQTKEDPSEQTEQTPEDQDPEDRQEQEDGGDESSSPEPNRSETIEDEQATFTFDDESEVAYETLVEALKDCYDPEIPVNLYDLGLIHEVKVTGREVHIDMTLTAPGCGFGPQIAKNVEMRLLEESSIDESSVEIVHDPPWDRDMVSEEGQAQLNMLGF